MNNKVYAKISYDKDLIAHMKANCGCHKYYLRCPKTNEEGWEDGVLSDMTISEITNKHGELYIYSNLTGMLFHYYTSAK